MQLFSLESLNHNDINFHSLSNISSSSEQKDVWMEYMSTVIRYDFLLEKYLLDSQQENTEFSDFSHQFYKDNSVIIDFLKNYLKAKYYNRIDEDDNESTLLFFTEFNSLRSLFDFNSINKIEYAEWFIENYSNSALK